MTFFINSNALPDPHAFNLTTTGDRVIVTAPDDRALTYYIESLVAACDATPTTFFLWINNGTEDVYINNGDQILANKAYTLTGHSIRLKPGWVLKCKAGSANHISVTVVIAMAKASGSGTS